jgi:hypothetical protein
MPRGLYRPSSLESGARTRRKRLAALLLRPLLQGSTITRGDVKALMASVQARPCAEESSTSRRVGALCDVLTASVATTILNRRCLRLQLRDSHGDQIVGGFIGDRGGDRGTAADVDPDVGGGGALFHFDDLALEFVTRASFAEVPRPLILSGYELWARAAVMTPEACSPTGANEVPSWRWHGRRADRRARNWSRGMAKPTPAGRPMNRLLRDAQDDS